jgi:DNA-binding CsgD family transcriptional regulator/tetratricopeptide (TPR) repeat protein
MVLLERDVPLALLADYADQARQGEGRVVLVAGEAGVGKSALLEQFAVGLTDARWCWGGCDGLFTPRPLGAFLDIAGQLGGPLARLDLAQAPRDELFTALLGALRQPGGLRVVVLEDIHWADEATLDLLRFLARRIREIPVLIAATYREDELAASYPLRVALGEFAVQRHTRRIDLAPLSPRVVETMAAGSGLDAAELYRVTGGNPFYVTEVMQTGLDRVPQSARDAVLARAARLGPPARGVLYVAALIGATVEPWLLERAAATSPEMVDELAECGLLVADGAALRFRHEIARRAVEEAIPGHRVPAIHARILAALRDTGCEDHAQLAFHAEAAGDRSAALHHATLAGGRAVELGSHREAAAQFERALRFADDEPAAALAARYDDLADELRMIDSLDGAADAYQRALELWRETGDQLREGDTLRRFSGALWRLCRGQEASAAAADALRTLEPLGPSVELAQAYVTVAGYRATDTHVSEAIAVARRGREIAAQLGSYRVQSAALIIEALAAWPAGQDWEALLSRALAVALDHDAVAEAGHAYTNLHELSCSSRRYAESGPYYLDGVAFCEEHDLGTYLCCLQGVRTATLERLGRWDEAVALSGTVLRRVLAAPVNRMTPIGTIGRIRARRAEPGAWEYLDEAMAAADGTGEPQYVVPARLGRAEAHWLAGDLAAARRDADLADQALAGADPWLSGETAAWLRRAGSDRGPQPRLAEPYRLQLDGDWRNAVKLWDEIGCRYDAALAMLDAAEEPALRQALDICQDLGATATARVIRRTMRKLGIRSIPVGHNTATRAHPLGLTRREQEVLDLICAGRTNAEIAAALVISVRTAGHHVSAVLAKLGVSTRHAAAILATASSPPQATLAALGERAPHER